MDNNQNIFRPELLELQINYEQAVREANERFTLESQNAREEYLTQIIEANRPIDLIRAEFRQSYANILNVHKQTISRLSESLLEQLALATEAQNPSMEPQPAIERPRASQLQNQDFKNQQK